MKIEQFDVTIDVRRHEVDAKAYTAVGSLFLEEVSRNGWSPEQTMANVPPKMRVGVRTSVRKKFALVPPLSLH